MDGPSAGLAPSVSADLLEQHVLALVSEGTSVVLVEQRALQALRCSNWAYMLAGGKAITAGPADQLLESDGLVATLLDASEAMRPTSARPAVPQGVGSPLRALTGSVIWVEHLVRCRSDGRPSLAAAVARRAGTGEGAARL